MYCYCSICRKTAGGGGYAINLGALTNTLEVEGEENLRVYNAKLYDREATEGVPISELERNFCGSCGTALWVYDPNWPELVHPFASAVDTPLPKPPEDSLSRPTSGRGCEAWGGCSTRCWPPARSAATGWWRTSRPPTCTT